MWEGYNDGEANSSALEDEFLCEYVDGTMDPIVREVFEEYLRMNPELRRHVDCLRNTRLLLCRYGCRCRAPRDLHERLRRQISCDLMKGNVPFQIILSDRLRSFATVTSALAVVFMVGMFAGVTLLDVDQSAVPAITLSEIRAAEESAHDTRLRTLSNHKAFYPTLSAFVPLSAVRSIISSDSHPNTQQIENGVAALHETHSAP